MHVVFCVTVVFPIVSLINTANFTNSQVPQNTFCWIPISRIAFRQYQRCRMSILPSPCSLAKSRFADYRLCQIQFRWILFRQMLYESPNIWQFCWITFRRSLIILSITILFYPCHRTTLQNCIFMEFLFEKSSFAELWLPECSLVEWRIWTKHENLYFADFWFDYYNPNYHALIRQKPFCRMSNHPTWIRDESPWHNVT